MIVGGYTLDLYCDVEGCLAGNFGGHPGKFKGFAPGCQQFYASERVHAEHGAKRGGWKLDKKNGRARCPECKGKRWSS